LIRQASAHPGFRSGSGQSRPIVSKVQLGELEIIDQNRDVRSDATPTVSIPL